MNFTNAQRADLIEPTVAELKAALRQCSKMLWEHHELGAISRIRQSGTCSICTAEFFEYLDKLTREVKS